MKLMPFLKDKFMLLILHGICMGALSAFLRLTGYGSTGVTLILIFWTVILAYGFLLLTGSEKDILTKSIKFWRKSTSGIY